MIDYYEHKLDPISVKPEWLADDDPCDYIGEDAPEWDGELYYTGALLASDCLVHSSITAIRIRANHWAVPYLKRGETPPAHIKKNN